VTEPEFVRELERHLNAMAVAFARMFGVTRRIRIKVSLDDI
jgi:hypothetical protein